VEILVRAAQTGGKQGVGAMISLDQFCEAAGISRHLNPSTSSLELAHPHSVSLDGGIFSGSTVPLISPPKKFTRSPELSSNRLGLALGLELKIWVKV
jgi:hypothetical protein